LLAGEPRQTVLQSSVSPRKILGLPSEYSTVPVSFYDCKRSRCPPSPVSRLEYLNSDPSKEEQPWLEACADVETLNTWSAFHSRRSTDVAYLARFAVLPPFHELAHTADMMAHSINVAIQTTKLLNPAQVPVLVGDLPLFALCKQIQWLNPEKMGEDKIFIMMGGMHIEKAAYTILGDLLDGSGWTTALVEAKVTTKGRAESILSATHITRTRYVYQVFFIFPLKSHTVCVLKN